MEVVEDSESRPQGGPFLCLKGQRVSGVARAKTAKGNTRILWRKAARKIEEGREEEGRKDVEQKMENEPMKEIAVPNEADAVGSQ